MIVDLSLSYDCKDFKYSYIFYCLRRRKTQEMSFKDYHLKKYRHNCMCKYYIPDFDTNIVLPSLVEVLNRPH